MLLVCGKQSGALTPQMVTAVFAQLITAARAEADASFLASLFRCLADCVRVSGGQSTTEGSNARPADALPQEIREGILAAARQQLQTLAERRKARVARFSGNGQNRNARNGSGAPDSLEEEREDAALLEELEDFALDEITRLLKTFDPNHTLLVAVGSVKELGIRGSEWESEDDG